MADAEVISAKGDAEASAKKEIGMAGADITREQFKAEADGLVDKFEAMGNMSDKARDHEEFRMSLETAFNEAIASIEAGKEIAKENAEVLSTALETAHIDITATSHDAGNVADMSDEDLIRAIADGAVQLDSRKVDPRLMRLLVDELRGALPGESEHAGLPPVSTQE